MHFKSYFIIYLLVSGTGLVLLPNNTRASDLEGSEVPANKTTDAEISAKIDNTLGDHTAYQALLRDLKSSVSTDNRQQVADLMSYPLDAEIDGNQATINGASMFLAFYDKIMIPEIISAIQNTAYADVLVSYEGVMLGDGQVWINSICQNETCSEVEVLVSTLQKRPN